ncbi:MAG: hypothetical protein H0W84_09700 [Bacteroidetes bacterium]|nr:hypothetical protein [Bacteroidota bacterium]
MINFIFAILIAITLSLYFIYSNEKINNLLLASNAELSEENRIRHETEMALQITLNEQEMLLSELHHRVKNNLAIISGLLNVQIENLKDDESRLIFEKTKDRIYSMSLIHNQLYANKLFSKIEFNTFIKNFCSHVNKNHATQTSFVIMQNTEKTLLDIKTAMPCALILNELITNSFNHAFKNMSVGVIEVGLKNDNGYITFSVSDTGVGINTKYLKGEKVGGISLVLSLIEQIDGKLTYENKGGSKFSIKFRSAS